MDEIALSMARDNLAVEKVAMMEGGIHKRLVASRTIVPSSESAVISPNAPKSSGQRGSFFRWIRCGKVLWTLLHFMGIAVYMYGWIARISLHNGSECEMTYSYPNFIQVETRFQSPSKLSDSYKLYKFVDGRDPRYQHLLQSTLPLTGTSHCGGSNATLVLYIPGHWGSYHQARSLGAHGTQWTRPRENPQKGQQALAQGSWSGKEAHLHDFVYEVYALDFAEQGGALHARFLERQSDFAAYVMTLLTDTCQVDHILVVAHSMGGYVARLAPQRHPHIQKLVPNILTLATPHQNPLYAFDESISQLHSSSLINTWMLSISGGVRDEMIAPQACRLEHGYSVRFSLKNLPLNAFCILFFPYSSNDTTLP